MVDTTLEEEPLRRLAVPDQPGIDQTLPCPTAFPVTAIENPRTIHVDLWLSRPNISIPAEWVPIIKNRILHRNHDQRVDLPPDEWMAPTLQESSVYLSKTGSRKGGQKALADARQWHHIAPSRKYDFSFPIGEVTRRIDYASQPIAVGSLHWVGIDFGDQLSLNDHLRTALFEPYKRERNQCLVLRLAAEYERYLQGCPRRPPPAPRVQTEARLIRHAEYQDSLRCRKAVVGPTAK